MNKLPYGALHLIKILSGTVNFFDYLVSPNRCPNEEARTRCFWMISSRAAHMVSCEGMGRDRWGGSLLPNPLSIDWWYFGSPVLGGDGVGILEEMSLDDVSH